jgi:hypothetical protein
MNHQLPIDTKKQTDFQTKPLETQRSIVKEKPPEKALDKAQDSE